MKLFEIKKRVNPRPVQTYLEPWMYKDRAQIQDWLDKNDIKAEIDEDLEIIADKRIAISGSWGDVMRALSKTDDLKGDWGIKNQRDFMIKGGIHTAPKFLVQVGRNRLLPVQFKLSDDFQLDDVSITSLIGCPYRAMGSFRVTGAPLMNLTGFPKFVKNSVEISTVSSLPNLTTIGNPSIKDLSIKGLLEKYIGTLEGIPEGVKDLRVGNLRSFKGIQGAKNLTGLTIMNKNVRNLLGILLNKNPEFRSIWHGGLEDPDLEKAIHIIYQHMHKDRDLLDCQEELIKAGLKEFARI